MSLRFYTNVNEKFNKIQVRGYENGVRFKEEVEYSPTLYLQTTKKTKYKTLTGKSVESIQPGTIKDCKEFFKRYEGLDNFEIYGMENYTLQYISDNYQDVKIKYDITKIKIITIDIEVQSEYGFPNVFDCAEEMLAITLQDYNTKHFTTFGVKPFENTRDDVTYILCSDEIDLIEKFLSFWENESPDIIMGWNNSLYDIPYIVGRISNIMGEKYVKRLSPWGYVRTREMDMSGRTFLICDISGITVIDYLTVYKKFTYVNRESYSLNYIAYVELGEKKLDHSEYETFSDFYKNDWQKFVSYNIKDVELVDRLEQKLKLLELCIMMAYNAKINFGDVFYQVRMWDAITYNYLRDRDIVIPQKVVSFKDDKFEGAYVKEPTPGMYDYVVGFDLASLYPSLIMCYNISPETLIDKKHPSITIDKVLNKTADTSSYPDYAICPNGCMYRKDIKGFFPELIEKMFDDRKRYKKMMIECEKENEINSSPELKNKISEYHNIQQNLKICLNSLYGSLGNQYFRYYKLDNAKSVTFSGQATIKWIESKLNLFLNKIVGTENYDYVIALDTDSVVGDSIIRVNGVEIKIADFYDIAGDNYLKNDTFNSNFVKQVCNNTALSLSSDGKLEDKPIKYVMKHKVKKKLFEIKSNGKNVIVTEDHSIIVKDKKDGEIKSITPNKLNPNKHYIINIVDIDTDTYAG